MFQGVKGHANSFAASCASKNRLGSSHLNDNLSRRLVLETHNLISRSLKNQHWWRRWSNVSRCRKTMRTHFLHPGNREKRLGRSPLSDVLIRRMPLKTHNLPSDVLKTTLFLPMKRCFKVSKAMGTHFLHPANRWKRPGLSPLSYFLIRWIFLRTHNLLLGHLKKRL
jgi:hypothetical protein